MTHEDFYKLFNEGEITVKVFAGDKIVECPEGCAETETNEHREVEAFEYAGKFFMRLHVESQWTYYKMKGYRKARVRGGKDLHYIKEFDTKTHANNYFKKFTEGWDMKRI